MTLTTVLPLSTLSPRSKADSIKSDTERDWTLAALFSSSERNLLGERACSHRIPVCREWSCSWLILMRHRKMGGLMNSSAGMNRASHPTPPPPHTHPHTPGCEKVGESEISTDRNRTPTCKRPPFASRFGEYCWEIEKKNRISDMQH